METIGIYIYVCIYTYILPSLLNVNVQTSIHILYSLHCIVPFIGLTKNIIRILSGNPKKQLQWRL